jgi:hypothetical protein
MDDREEESGRGEKLACGDQAGYPYVCSGEKQCRAIVMKARDLGPRVEVGVSCLQFTVFLASPIDGLLRGGTNEALVDPNPICEALSDLIDEVLPAAINEGLLKEAMFAPSRRAV